MILRIVMQNADAERGQRESANLLGPPEQQLVRYRIPRLELGLIAEQITQIPQAGVGVSRRLALEVREASVKLSRSFQLLHFLDGEPHQFLHGGALERGGRLGLELEPLGERWLTFVDLGLIDLKGQPSLSKWLELESES